MEMVENVNMVIRLSHRQRWTIYSFKDIYHTLYRLINMFDYKYNGYERRLISILWCILGNIVYTDAFIDGHTVCHSWQDFADPVNTIIDYSVNNTVYFQSSPTKKKYVIDNIRYYAMPRSHIGHVVYGIYFYKDHVVGDYKTRQMEMFHRYSIVRKDSVTLDGLI